MSSPSDQPFRPSVYDRLLGAETGPTTSRTQQLRELKQSVRRDIENLLNTRWRCSAWPPDLDQVESSLVNYGIPDFTGANMNHHDARRELRNIIERVLREFEPRFKEVHVELLEGDEETDRTLQLRIDALLHAEPVPEPVVFESQLETITSEFHVKTTQ